MSAVKVKLCRSSLKVVVGDGSPTAVKFGIPGPQGVIGPKGETGPRGIQGPPGVGSNVEVETDDSLVPGSAVFAKPSGRVGLALATAFPQTRFAGISQNTTLPGFVAEVATNGPLVLASAEWDNVTGQVGGLTPGSPYFLSTSVAGMITPVPPSTSGLFSVKVGKAIDSVTLDIDPRNPIKL